MPGFALVVDIQLVGRRGGVDAGLEGSIVGGADSLVGEPQVDVRIPDGEPAEDAMLDGGAGEVVRARNIGGGVQLPAEIGILSERHGGEQQEEQQQSAHEGSSRG